MRDVCYKTTAVLCGKNISVDGNIVRVFDTGAGDELVKLFFDPERLDYSSDAIKVGAYTVGATPDGRLRVCRADGKTVVEEYDGDATVYAEEKDFSLASLEGHKKENVRCEYRTQINIKLADVDCVYGLGDKAAGVDRRGYEYVQWNTDDPSQHNENYKSLYKSINFVLVSGKGGFYGIFYPDTHKCTFNIGAYKADLMFIGSECGRLDYYIILGETPRDVVREYTRLVGRPALVRLKMLGNQQSRWSYGSQDEVEKIADGYAENGLPLDYIHLDIDYMDGYRVYTVDKTRFPDLRMLSEKLEKRGVELVAIIDPGVKSDDGYAVYRDLSNMNGLAVRNGEVYHNAVWPGDSVYPDYFDREVARYVTETTANFMRDYKISGIWCDMNEPASFNGPLPDDVMCGEYCHDRWHNLYGEYMARATAAAFELEGKRPYVITRACFGTSAPFTIVWNGDNQSLRAHLKASLPQIATMGVCGFPIDGVDIGGFGGDCTKELLIRWIEANIFSPLLRNHSSMHTRSQEPFAFDGETTEIYGKFLRLRYDLAPYLYDLAHSAHECGEPIIRPMFYSYPDDEACRRISDQIMIGEYLMLAPITDQGCECRAVYFPRGEWIGWKGINADVKTRSKGYAAVPMQLECSGLYYRADAVIPMYSGLRNLSEKPSELIVFLGGKAGRCISYEDDGKSVAGGRNVYSMSFDGKIFRLSTVVRGYDSDYKTLTVVCDDKRISVPFDYERKIKVL